MKNVTLADIARELGVSSNAVSLAIRGKEGVSESLRKQALQKAEEMGYFRSDKIAGNIVALIPQRIDTHGGGGGFYQQLCFCMDSFARSLGYLLLTCSVSEYEEENRILHPILNNVSYKGIITIGNLSREYCRRLSELETRFVMTDQYYDDVITDSINTANSSGGYLLTKYLIERGHKKIQYFGQVRKNFSLADRWNGYKRAMRDYGLPILHNRFIDADERDSTHEVEFVRQAIESLEEMPTAFVCGHDYTAKNIRDVLCTKGLTCPEDYSLVGFDNIQDAAIASLDITTYRTPLEQIAETAVRMILDTELIHPHREQIFGEMIIRNSVKDIC